MSAQAEFNFAQGNETGYTNWIAARKIAGRELARKMNLPLGHQVEVWLVGGVRLRGTLRLAEEFLLIEEANVRHLGLMVDHVSFTYREIDSCVRLD